MARPAHLLRRRWDPKIRRRVATVVTAVLVLVIAAAVVIATTRTLTTQQAKDQQLDDTAQKALDAADPIVRLCAGSDEVARRLREVGACSAAQEVVAQPVAEPRVVEGKPGPGPTDAQIAAAVTTYLQAHPPPAGRAPSVGEIAAAVSDFLTANPPQPGRPPTAAEIAAAVDTYLSAHPPPAGRPPTAEEIQAEVAAYLAANPPAKGDDGEDSTVPGPQGAPPAEWSWPDPVVPMLTHTCTRSGGPDTAAIYSCS